MRDATTNPQDGDEDVRDGASAGALTAEQTRRWRRRRARRVILVAVAALVSIALAVGYVFADGYDLVDGALTFSPVAEQERAALRASRKGATLVADADLARRIDAGKAVAAVDALEPTEGAAPPTWHQDGNVLTLAADARAFAYRITFKK